jgi:ubiquinone/menaquinone biosynthesis C-methylase UbiE
MVNIHHHEPMSPVPDAEAMDIFERQWVVYQKFVDNDYGEHQAAYRTLHHVLATTAKPFSILDLACGDAKSMVAALKGTSVAHYHGVDLAPPALDLAAHNLDALGCDVELEHSDFTDAVQNRPEPADVVWIGLSLHHLRASEKQALMGDIRSMIGPAGTLMVYEPTCLDGESRDEYLDRYEAVARGQWTGFDSDEMAALMQHVRSSDYPETTASWNALGRNAGFAKTDLLFINGPDLFRIFRFAG